MDINFETDKLLVLNYPEGAGGKFISLALGVHPEIIVQDEKLAGLQMRDNADLLMGYNLAMKAFSKSINGDQHFEYGCGQLAGFRADMLIEDEKADEKNCNDFWRELTNQKKFYYFLIDHTDKNLLAKYTKRKTIRLINYDWILQDRKWQDKTLAHTTDGECITFDMQSIKDNKAFIDEIYKIFDWLGMKAKNSLGYSVQLETLRTKFLETYQIGFNEGGMNEGR